jgi:meiotically up-regulated gene 157 (Mug157) protein
MIVVSYLIAWFCLTAATTAAAPTCQNRRPPPSARRFVSSAIENTIKSVANTLVAQNKTTLACVFANTLPNTLDTTVLQYASQPNGTSFIITGDINAMWLRDSMNQVLPYIPYLTNDHNLKLMVAGLIHQQTQLILADPYANAHNLPDIAGPSPNINDQTTYPGFGPSRSNAMVPGIYERKYELDSLCAFLKLSNEYYSSTNDLLPFQNIQWMQALALIVKVMKDMQLSSETSFVQEGGATYQFQRQASEPTDTLLHGVGHPGAVTGMVRSAFRPSDDATTLPFLIPANAMAVVELRKTIGIVQSLSKTNPYRTKEIVQELTTLANAIDQGIQKYGIGIHPLTGIQQYAYEVDGFGNMYFADDANIPSLLSLPYLGYLSATDPTYVATRKFLLSANNPWYFSGTAGEGIGGPHVGLNSIWPMSVIVRALTSIDPNEITDCITMLMESTADTGLMHESFNKDNVNDYTRPWFAWANSLFGGLILKVYGGKSTTRIHVLQEQ